MPQFFGIFPPILYPDIELFSATNNDIKQGVKTCARAAARRVSNDNKLAKLRDAIAISNLKLSITH